MGFECVWIIETIVHCTEFVEILADDGDAIPRCGDLCGGICTGPIFHVWHAAIPAVVEDCCNTVVHVCAGGWIGEIRVGFITVAVIDAKECCESYVMAVSDEGLLVYLCVCE